MSSRQSRKKLGIGYSGTIVPYVAKLMNHCRGSDIEFRIVSELMLEEEKKEKVVFQPKRMTIVVDMESGEYRRHFWG